ncbi:hypothetical protein niasHT_002805 [Heterodera trifolii]|uniref:Uncharacterized protein n=1 Tax=Heterodera trifolii TaxID=157864 RepID=A0ABD2M872_9BILA
MACYGSNQGGSGFSNGGPSGFGSAGGASGMMESARYVQSAQGLPPIQIPPYSAEEDGPGSAGHKSAMPPIQIPPYSAEDGDDKNVKSIIKPLLPGN